MPDEQEVTQVEETKIVKGTTTFAPKSPTPKWAVWMFRTEFVLSKMLTYYLVATDRVPSRDIKEYMLIIATIDLGTWLFAHSLGVKKKDLGLPGED